MICRKGGAGKTTLAIHLAVEAMRRGAKVLVIDTDQQASAAKILQRRGEEPPDVVMTPPSMLSRSLSEAKEAGYDLVMIDTPPQADQAPLTAAKAANLVIVPMRPSIVDIDAIQASVETCELARKVPIFVLNGVASSGIEAKETADFIEAQGGKVAHTKVGLRKVYAQAFTLGLAAQEYSPKAPAAKEIMSLFEELEIPLPGHTAQPHNHTKPLVGQV